MLAVRFVTMQVVTEMTVANVALIDCLRIGGFALHSDRPLLHYSYLVKFTDLLLATV